MKQERIKMQLQSIIAGMCRNDYLLIHLYTLIGMFDGCLLIHSTGLKRAHALIEWLKWPSRRFSTIICLVLFEIQ